MLTQLNCRVELCRRCVLTMEHIVDSCPLTKLDGGLLSLHEAEEYAISWLKMTATKALAK